MCLQHVTPKNLMASKVRTIYVFQVWGTGAPSSCLELVGFQRALFFVPLPKYVVAPVESMRPGPRARFWLDVVSNRNPSKSIYRSDIAFNRVRACSTNGNIPLHAFLAEEELCGFSNMWKALAPLDQFSELHLTFYRLAKTPRRLSDEEVLAMITVQQVSEPRTFWSGVPSANAAVRDFVQGACDADNSDGEGGALTDDEVSDNDHIEDDPGDDDTNDIPDWVRSLGEELERLGFHSDSGSDADGSDVGERPGDADGLPDVPVDARPPDAVLADVLPPPAVVPDPPLAAHVPLPPLAPAGAGVGGGGGWRRPGGGREDPYPKLLFGFGHIKIRENAHSLDAHCDKCSAKADRTVKSPANEGRYSAQGRPLGLLLLFLKFDCGGNADLHKVQFKRWQILPGMRVDDRRAVRAEAWALPVFQPAFALERARRVGEPEEPYFLAGFG